MMASDGGWPSILPGSTLGGTGDQLSRQIGLWAADCRRIGGLRHGGSG